LLVFEVANKRACLDPDHRLGIQSEDNRWDVQIMRLRELPRAKPVITIPPGPVMPVT
jgi:hypothetical protein